MARLDGPGPVAEGLACGLSLTLGRAVSVTCGEHVDGNKKGHGYKIEHVGYLEELGDKGYAYHHGRHIDQNEPDSLDLLAVV